MPSRRSGVGQSFGRLVWRTIAFADAASDTIPQSVPLIRQRVRLKEEGSESKRREEGIWLLVYTRLALGRRSIIWQNGMRAV